MVNVKYGLFFNQALIKEFPSTIEGFKLAVKMSKGFTLKDEDKFEIKIMEKNDEDEIYEESSKLFVGKTIKNFFCNGFFGGSTYDLEESRITNIYQDDGDGIIIEVKKRNGKYDYACFNESYDDWKCVYEYLKEWTSEDSEE